MLNRHAPGPIRNAKTKATMRKLPAKASDAYAKALSAAPIIITLRTGTLCNMIPTNGEIKPIDAYMMPKALDTTARLVENSVWNEGRTGP
jgi:hypothetical protein